MSSEEQLQFQEPSRLATPRPWFRMDSPLQYRITSSLPRVERDMRSSWRPPVVNRVVNLGPVLSAGPGRAASAPLGQWDGPSRPALVYPPLTHARAPNDRRSG